MEEGTDVVALVCFFLFSFYFLFLYYFYIVFETHFGVTVRGLGWRRLVFSWCKVLHKNSMYGSNPQGQKREVHFLGKREEAQ